MKRWQNLEYSTPLDECIRALKAVGRRRFDQVHVGVAKLMGVNQGLGES